MLLLCYSCTLHVPRQVLHVIIVTLSSSEIGRKPYKIDIQNILVSLPRTGLPAGLRLCGPYAWRWSCEHSSCKPDDLVVNEDEDDHVKMT